MTQLHVIILYQLFSTNLVIDARPITSVSEQKSSEAQDVFNAKLETTLYDDGCGTHDPRGLTRSKFRKSGKVQRRSAATSSELDKSRCAHCPTDGICDNPAVRNLYMNRSEQLDVSVTWHLLPDSNGNYDVSLADLNGSKERLQQSFSGIGLNFTSKFVHYSTEDKPLCSGSSLPNTFSDLRMARVATSNHPTSPFPYCFTPTDSYNLPHLYFHRLEISSESKYTILIYSDPTVSAASVGSVPYGAHQRKGDTLFYSIVANSTEVEVVLYRFPKRQSFVIEETPSAAISSISLPLGINMEYRILEDGDYFMWAYNKEDGKSVVIQYFVSFFKHHCYSQDEFASCFKPHLEPNSFNVVVLPADVFQTLYRLSGNVLRASAVSGFAFFPFEVTPPWQVGLSFVAAEAVFNPSSTVLQHEIGHNMGLWHLSHGVTETLQCQPQTNNRPCTEDQFRCLAQDKCIPVQWYCNGIPDCDVDRSDEPPNCRPLCYSQCENSCSESNDFNEYIRDRVGDFCEDTPAAYTAGSPGCGKHAVGQLDRSTNLMATRREAVTSLSPQQNARARCWLMNGPHQSFVECKKTIRIQYGDYTNDCLSTFNQTLLVAGNISVECTADPCHYINPCKNGGRCVSDYGTVSCNCTATGYCGLFCDAPSTSDLDCPFQQSSTSVPVSFVTVKTPSSVEPFPEATGSTQAIPSCLATTYGCCADGITVAGPSQTDCLETTIDTLLLASGQD